MQRRRGTIYGIDGNVLSGVSVNPKKAGTAVNATLYADNGITTKSNPFTNDADGSFEYYAPNGLYDDYYTRTGNTFTDDNAKGILLYDPRDDAGAVMCLNEFRAPYIATSDLLTDGNHWRIGGGSVTRVVGDTTYRNGWLDVLESGAAAGSVFLSENANVIALLWVVSTDLLILEMRVEKVGDAVAGTRRIGLSSAALTTDPANGIYVRQIDTNNAFLVCRASSTESTQDLGQTLNNPTRIRVHIATAGARAFVDDVAKTPITTNIPTAILGLAIGGGATASAAGIRADYLNVISEVRV